MSAADLLRQAIEAAPDGLHVDVDGAGDLNIWTGRWTNALVLGGDERDAVMRLIGLLLAAAPHLAGMLNLRERRKAARIDGGAYIASLLDGLDAIDRAIEEAAR